MPTEQDYEPFEAPPSTFVDTSSGGTGEAPHGGRTSVNVVAPARPKKGLTEDDYEPYDSKDEKAVPPPYREVSPGEAAVHGYIDLGAMGLAPAIAGAAAAGNAPGGTGTAEAMQGVASENPGAEAVGEGISRLWNDHFGSHPDPAAREAYSQGSQAVLNDRNLASDQHFVPYLLGQLGAAMSMPGTLGRAAVTGFFGKIAPGMVEGLTGRLGGAALTGGVMAGAQGAGEATSEGRPEDIPLEAGKGFATGAVMGAGGAAALGGIGSAAGKLGIIKRSARDPDAEAGRKILESLGADYNKFGPSMSPEEIAATQAAGTEKALVDVGHEKTRALARSAANTSPEGRQALEDFTRRRFEQQSPRISGFIRRLTGGADASADQDVIDAAKLAFNKPAYRRAYQVGDRPIWSEDLKSLASTSSVAKAIGGAAKRAQDRMIADDMNLVGMRPSINIDSQGGVHFQKGPTGVPVYPNLQFWDYVQRELQDQIGAAYRTGAKEEGAVMTTLRNRLLQDLDRQVPEFAQARQTAASFFGAENALEAGQKFVMGNQDVGQARRALAAMKPAERELFARGFASDLAAKIESIPDNQDVINKAFLSSTTARDKINMALGSQRANELETLLRSEWVVDKARKALGNSTTARQAAEMSKAGGTMAAAEELSKHTTLTGLILTGLGVHKAGRYFHGIDEKVAQRVAEMLASGDIPKFDQAMKIMSNSPIWMRALRAATGASVRAGAPDVGFTNLAAGATVGAEDIVDIFKKQHEPEHRHEAEPAYQDSTQ